MNRTPLSIALAASALVVLAPSAPAAPVATSRIAGVDLELRHEDGSSLRIDLRATTAAQPRLTLQVSTCEPEGCSAFTYYEARLAPGSVSLDAGAARGSLRTTVAGRPLVVSWEPSTQQGVVLGGTEGSSGDGGEALSSYVGEPAVATVSWGGRTCTLGGLVGDEARVESPEGNPGAALPLSRFRSSGVLAC